MHYDNNNVPFYVGCGDKKRARSRRNRRDSKQAKPENTWRERAKDGFTIDIVGEFEDDVALAIESLIIQGHGRLLDGTGTLVNIATYGAGLSDSNKMKKDGTLSKEHKSKIGKSLLGREFSTEHKKRLSENKKMYWAKRLNKEI